MEQYKNRQEAGKILADLLQPYAHENNVVVLALPRGGVPVAYEIANKLSLPLDILIVRKLGVPGHEEYAMGALAGNLTFLDKKIIKELDITQEAIEQVLQNEQQELARREYLYRGTHPFPDLSKKTIILVDDGIATGATIKTAIKKIRQYPHTKIILAVPVAPYSTGKELALLVEQFICPLPPKQFRAVGLWYENFSQTSDNEVIELLKK